jgi:hypothetical protein
MLVQVLLLRLLAWIGLPLLLIVLVAGPARVAGWCRAAWEWLFGQRLQPARVFESVVAKHREHVAELTDAIKQAERSEANVRENILRSQKAIVALDQEAAAAAGIDELEARAALYKLNLEKRAQETFQEQAARLHARIVEARKRLYLLELQLRQYEAGRDILLAQLAEARTVEQQYALANQFDAFNAVAEWKRAEGLVQDAAASAASADRVLTDTAALPLAGPAPVVDPADLDAQMAALIADLKAKA